MSGCVRSCDRFRAFLLVLRASRGDASRSMRPLYPLGRIKSPLSRRDVGPQRLKLVGLEEIAPWRHLALAARHRIDEAFALVGRKFPQIECRPGVLHARAVTRRAWMPGHHTLRTLRFDILPRPKT